MAQVIKATFQLRRGLLEVWEKNNPILAKGEPSFIVDKNALKIGDGVTPWKELEYIGLNQAGEDYVLTDADKAEIAEMAADLVEVPDSGGNVDYGTENAGKLLYVGKDGTATVLTLGSGLAIVNGVLTITSQQVTSAICGESTICGNTICGGK